jgi:hypothetical protein
MELKKEKQMKSATKKQSSQAPRVIDPNNPLFDSVERLFVGLSPQERAKKMCDFVQSLKPAKPAPKKRG